MPFTGTGTGIQNASDVFLNSPGQYNVLSYNGATAKWNNTNIAALSFAGGNENRLVATTSSATLTIDLSKGNVFFYTLAQSITTFAVTGATAGKACSFTLYLKQNGTGNWAVTWGSSVIWPGGTAPTVTKTAGKIDIFVFESLKGDAGPWFGAVAGQNYAGAGMP